MTKKRKRFNFTIIVVLLLFAFILNAFKIPLEDNDWNDYGLKGKVKSFKMTTYKAEIHFGNIVKGERVEDLLDDRDKEYFFDVNGNVRRVNDFNQDGTIRYRLEYKYDENGRNYETNSYRGDGILDDKCINRFNNKGKVDLRNNYNTEGKLYRSEYLRYNDKELISERKLIYNDGSSTIISYKYNADSKLILENWIYDSIFKEEHKELNIDNSFSLYEYDNNGNKIEEVWSSGTKFTYKYNNQNTLIEIYKFADDGSLIERQKFTYEYDKIGNWIKRITYLNDKPIYIKERLFEYYD